MWPRNGESAFKSRTATSKLQDRGTHIDQSDCSVCLAARVARMTRRPMRTFVLFAAHWREGYTRRGVEG
jgi:hypothetical protein